MMFALGVAVFAGLWMYAIATRKSGLQKLAALAEEVRPRGGQVFRTTLQGEQRVFLLDKCTLYSLDVSDTEIERTEVLSTDFYFFLDVCGKQTIEMEGEYLRVFFSTQAIGAGGGNTTGGDYRSKDGLFWEKRSGNEWVPRKEAQR